jgi:SAM-dependent methyltransferase
MQQFAEKQKIQEESYSFPYHYLDIAVKEYRLIHRVLAMSRIRIVKDLLKPFQGQWILDAGCGDGRLCYELKTERVKLVGVDLSDRALAFARVFNPEVEFFRQDLKHLSLPHKFHAIIMIESLEHIAPEEIPEVLRNLSDVLRNDGKLIITVPSMAQSLEPKHYQHFSRESLGNILAGHFRIKQFKGHIRIFHLSGYRVKWFWFLRRMGEIFYSSLMNVGIGPLFFEIMNRYFEDHVAFGKPEECMTIIAECEKI